MAVPVIYRDRDISHTLLRRVRDSNLLFTEVLIAYNIEYMIIYISVYECVVVRYIYRCWGIYIIILYITYHIIQRSTYYYTAIAQYKRCTAQHTPDALRWFVYGYKWDLFCFYFHLITCNIRRMYISTCVPPKWHAFSSRIIYVSIYR